MTTQIVFKIDSELKKAAQKRAAREGITLSDLFQSAAHSFVAGKINLGLVPENEIPNAKTIKLLHRLEHDVSRRRNLSPVFTTAREAVAYLKKNAC